MYGPVAFINMTQEHFQKPYIETYIYLIYSIISFRNVFSRSEVFSECVGWTLDRM